MKTLKEGGDDDKHPSRIRLSHRHTASLQFSHFLQTLGFKFLAEIYPWQSRHVCHTLRTASSERAEDATQHRQQKEAAVIFKKITACTPEATTENPDADNPQDKSMGLTPETLTAAAARKTAESKKKERALAAIESTVKQIILFAECGSLQISVDCDHPDFIAYFREKGFTVTKGGGILGPSIIEW